MSEAIDALDREWQTYDRRPAVRRFIEELAADPFLAYPTASALVDDIRRTGFTDPGRADRLLAGIMANGRDEIAQRIVLQALLPGLCNVIRRLTVGQPHDRRLDVAAEVVSQAGLRIATYPFERRRRAIASNVLRDVERDYRKAHKLHGAEVPVDSIDAAGVASDPFAQVDDRLHLVELLHRARHDDVITARDLEFVIGTYVPDRAADDLARARRMTADALRRARLRAEARLGRFGSDLAAA